MLLRHLAVLITKGLNESNRKMLLHDSKILNIVLISSELQFNSKQRSESDLFIYSMCS